MERCDVVPSQADGRDDRSRDSECERKPVLDPALFLVDVRPHHLAHTGIIGERIAKICSSDFHRVLCKSGHALGNCLPIVNITATEPRSGDLHVYWRDFKSWLTLVLCGGKTQTRQPT